MFRKYAHVKTIRSNIKAPIALPHKQHTASKTFERFFIKAEV